MSRDRYELGELLGKGHFTNGVYRARHTDLGRFVALKLLDLRGPEYRSYLLAEGRRMAQLPQNDHIVQVYDAGDWDEDHVYLAVELCEGGSLDDMSRAGPIDPQTACRLISDACRGLHALHQEGMLHLDVRPGNILLSGSTPKISDFGLARSSDDARIGSIYPPHAAPELILSRTGSASADQYAMAMTLGHILSSGEICGTPLPGEVTERAWRVRPDLGTLGLHVPERIRKVVKRGTAFDPVDRFADVEAFKQALDRATPAVSFTSEEEGRLLSVDGSVAISWFEKQGSYSVEVRVSGRRKAALGASGLDLRNARRQVERLVTKYADLT